MEQISPAQLLAKLNSPEGKKLLALMQKDGGSALSKAAAAANAGNYSQVQAILSPILSGTEAEKLAKTIYEQFG